MQNNYDYPIKKFLVQNQVRTAVGYYNKYVQTLEFIYYGLKFIVRFTNADFTDEVKLSDYNNYQIFMMNDYNGNNINDIYISNREQFILIINHSYDYYHSYVSNDLILLEDATLKTVPYKFEILPFHIDLYNMYNTGNGYITKRDTDEYETYINKDTSYIIENEQVDESNPMYVVMKNKSNIYTYFRNNEDYRTKGIITDDNGVLSLMDNVAKANVLSNDVGNKYESYFFEETGNYRNKQTIALREKHPKGIDASNSTKAELDRFVEAFTSSDLNIYIIPQ